MKKPRTKCGAFFRPKSYKIEKGEEAPALFVPNLTINLTYLCYGETKILVLCKITKVLG
jgi:hypothetical protein